MPQLCKITKDEVPPVRVVHFTMPDERVFILRDEGDEALRITITQGTYWGVAWGIQDGQIELTDGAGVADMTNNIPSWIAFIAPELVRWGYGDYDLPKLISNIRRALDQWWKITNQSAEESQEEATA